MKKIYFLVMMVVAINGVWGQTSTQNFGTGTGSHTIATGSTAFIPNPSSGTTWARAGAVVPNAPIVLENSSNPLGTTGSFVRAVASSSTSVAKFSPWVGYTGGTEFYTSFKVLFGDASAGNTATSGVWKFYQGAGSMYSNASDFSGAEVFTGLTFTYGAGGALALTYRAGSSNVTTGLTTTAFSSATVYTIEIVGNNKTSGTINYAYNGNPQTVAVQKFDLYSNGILIGDDLAEALLPVNTAISSGTFIGISSVSNVANIFVDDAVTYNAVPASIGTPPTPTTTSISPSSAIEGGPGFTLTVDGTNFINGLSTVRWDGSNRTTTFVNSTQLTATINAADIATAGSASVDVITTGNPTASNAQTFTIDAATSPLITLTPTSLTAFTYVAGSGPSTLQSFSVSGSNLTTPPGNILVNATGTDYEVYDLATTSWVSSFNIPYATATLGATNVDVRLKAGLAVGSYNGQLIVVSGGGDSKNETVSGSVTLGTPVAVAPTIFTATSFTAAWGMVAGASAGYVLDVSTSATFSVLGVLGTEGFENVLTLFTETFGTGVFQSGISDVSADRPISSPLAASGTYSFGKANGAVSITSSDINTSSSSATQLSFKLASFSIGSTGNGADAGDIVTVEISPDGGTTYYSTVRVLGNNNAYWEYAAAGVASTAYDGDASPIEYQPASGGSRTTDGYSTVTVTGLPSVSNLKIRITLLNNSANELWVVDDLTVTGTVGSFLPGYNNLAVLGTTQAVTVPGPGTYYFRVRATDGVVTSPNSNVVSVVINDQNTADFRSSGNGDYDAPGTWEFNISPASFYTAATQKPTILNDVLVQDGHTVTLTGNEQANTLTLDLSGNVLLGSNNLVVNNTSGGFATGYIRTNGTGALTVTNITTPAKQLPVGNSTYNPLQINNGSGLDWTVRVEDAVNNVVAPFNTDKAINRTWHIAPSATVSVGPDITFNFDDADNSQLVNAGAYNGDAVRTVQVWHYGNGSWTAAGTSLAMTPANGSQSLTLSGYTNFSPFAISKTSSPLPVTILSFAGQKERAVNVLRWSTANEFNNTGFEILRSTDGINYRAIGFVNSLAVNGNSSDVLNYSFTDIAVSGTKQYYRLRQIDFDNRSNLSTIVFIKGERPLITSIDGVFPNPASSAVNVLIAASEREKVTLVVSDISGRVVSSKVVSVEQGSNTIPMDINQLNKGSYVIRLVCENACNSAAKFMKL